MNKTLVITTIVFVAVVMGLSTVAPALQQAFAHDVTEPRGRQQLGGVVLKALHRLNLIFKDSILTTTSMTEYV